MQKRVRCPICGMVVWRSQIEKSHSIDVLEMNRVVRAKGRGGFKYIKSWDAGLVSLVRAKIKALYEKLFPDNTVQLKVPGELNLNPGLNQRPSLTTLPELRRFPILVKSSEVKMVG